VGVNVDVFVAGWNGVFVTVGVGVSVGVEVWVNVGVMDGVTTSGVRLRFMVGVMAVVVVV
jgi:hypothetical protein